MNWQPIETAPKDAKDGVLGWVPHYYQGRGGVAVICWVKWSMAKQQNDQSRAYALDVSSRSTSIMKWRVTCGYIDWSVWVEAATEQEAIEMARAEIIDRISKCDTFFAASYVPETEGEQG